MNGPMDGNAEIHAVTGMMDGSPTVSAEGRFSTNQLRCGAATTSRVLEKDAMTLSTLGTVRKTKKER